MKKILIILLLLTLNSFSQTIIKTTEFEISISQKECNYSWYEAITITNLSKDTVNIEFDIESYWSNKPEIGTVDDEHTNFIINPNDSVSGGCQENRSLLKWSGSNISAVKLIKLNIINLKFTKK